MRRRRRLRGWVWTQRGEQTTSLFYNGIRNTLDGVAEHADKYPDFAGGDGRYHIPSDQYSQLEQLRQTGRIEGFSDSCADSVRARLDGLQSLTGRNSEDLIGPGNARYDEVQRGRVHETVRNREEELLKENERLKDAARSDHGPSLAGFGKATAIGAAVGGGLRVTQTIWAKHREGKNPFKGQFTVEDWRDVGIVAAQGAGMGGIAGGGVYLLTNSTALAAPFAGAFVSAVVGIGGLVRQYHAGTIEADEFVEMAHIIAADAAIIGAA